MMCWRSGCRGVVTVDDRTVKLSVYWAGQAAVLRDSLDVPGTFEAEDMPEIMRRAQALAVAVTQMWDEAGDRQSAERDDMREIGNPWDHHYYGHTPNSPDGTCRWCREQFMGADDLDGEAG